MDDSNQQEKQHQDSKAGKNVFVFEDKEYHSNMLDNLNMLRKNRQFCDVILQVGSKQDIHEIFAHKVVLSSSSPYFLEMFSNDQHSSGANGTASGLFNSKGGSPNGSVPQQYRLVNNQSTTAGNQSLINHHQAKQEFDPEAFDYIVDYAYTARLEIPKDKVRQVYAIAARLKMTSVAAKCGQFLLSMLTPENCLEVRNLRAVLKDPYLLQSVDGYIRQNFEKIVQNKNTSVGSGVNSLLHAKVEFLLDSEQEEGAINDRHMFNEVLDWIRDAFSSDTLDLATLKEKLIMLYYNKQLNLIQDCAEIEPRSPEELEIIEDYRKLSKRLSAPNLTRAASSDRIDLNNQNGAKAGKMKITDKSSVPSKPRQFLFARSDSESSLSSVADDDDQDWKLLANCRMGCQGQQTLVGLVTISGQLIILTIKFRINQSNARSTAPNSAGGSNHGSVSDNYCLIPPMSSPRCAVGTAELGGKLFVCGGYDRGECLNTVELYDTLTNKWEILQHMQVPRGRFDIAVANGNVYAIGGCDGHKDLNSAEFYDSLTLNWTLIPSAPVVRSNAGVCSMDSKIFVIGGWSGNRGLTRCDLYDPEIGKWTEIGHLKTGRYQTGVCALDKVIYAVGGCDSWSCLNSVEAYDNKRGCWQLVAPLQTARRGCGVAAFEGKVYVVGGHDGIHALCSVEVYDPHEDCWSFGQPMTVARANVGVAIVGRRLYAVGGFNGKTFLNTIEYYDFDTDEWTTSVPIVDNGANSAPLSGHHNQTTLERNGHGASLSGTNETGHQNGTQHGHHHSDLLKVNSKMKNSLSNEPLVEVEETVVGH